MSKTDLLGEEPEFIYVVVYDGKHRIYTREGQALNWFAKKQEGGSKVKLFKYSLDAQLGG